MILTYLEYIYAGHSKTQDLGDLKAVKLSRETNTNTCSRYTRGAIGPRSIQLPKMETNSRSARPEKAANNTIIVFGAAPVRI